MEFKSKYNLKNPATDVFTWVFYRAVQFLNKLAFQYFNYLTIVFIQLIFKQFSLDVRPKDRPHELSRCMFSIYFNQGCFMTHFCNSYENINRSPTCSLMYLVLLKLLPCRLSDKRKHYLSIQRNLHLQTLIIKTLGVIFSPGNTQTYSAHVDALFRIHNIHLQ